MKMLNLYHFVDTTLKSIIPHLFRMIISNTRMSNVSPETINTMRLIMSTIVDVEELYSLLLVDNLSLKTENFPAAERLLIELCQNYNMKINALETNLNK